MAFAPALQLRLPLSLPFSSHSHPLNRPIAFPRPPRTHSLMVRADLGFRDGDDAGIGGSSTMNKIVDKLKEFGYIDDDIDSRSEKSQPELSPLAMRDDEVRFPWEKPSVEKDGERALRRKRSRTSLAELTLPEGELRRLRHLALRIKSKVRIKGKGVTNAVVDAIHEKWRTEEVVRLKCEGVVTYNMKKVHEDLERRTGGLVIWRSGAAISLYRGVSYGIPRSEKKKYLANQMSGGNGAPSFQKLTLPSGDSLGDSQDDIMQGPSASAEKKIGAESPQKINYEEEIDKLLDSLGPRYTDWPGSGPFPVDADLLPGVVPGYKPPYRLLPYGERPFLGFKEAADLRRLARVLPPHFALGRSRRHEGLAVAMAKLWQRSSIAKIALKRGVQLTTSERMAEDIKKLTGGMLLSRNNEYLVFFRGKNFLALEVAEALIQREKLAKTLQDEEEQARLRASSSVLSNIEDFEQSGSAGTLGETLQADARWGAKLDEDHENKMMRAVEIAKHTHIVKKIERKLSLAEEKLMKAEKALAKVEEFLKPLERTSEPESITDEERFMFRKLGMRMKAFLLLGRRGVFDGTVENMHLHWKYRELVKVLVKAKTFSQVRGIALSLEAESGGVLVSVDKVSKGFAIIVYRGKDYQRPSVLRPKNLLTKRKALARSIELQRREALNNHISNLQSKVRKLKSELKEIEDVNNQGDEDLYAKLDSAYATDEDEETRDEGDETYLGTFNTGKESVDGTENVDFDAYDDDKEHNNFDNKDEESDEDYSSDETDPALSFCYDQQSELPEPFSDPSNLCV
ncbi:putative RNA-binding, CRM domain, CRM-domain containing factor CFM3, YhbY-like superfamily [Dioscorea sansibarensis]